MTDQVNPLDAEIGAEMTDSTLEAIKGGEVCHLLERPDLMEIAGLTRYNALEVSEADGALTSRRLLTRSSDLTREGLAVNATRKRGLEPIPVPVPFDLTPELLELAARWPVRFRSKVAVTPGCWEWQAGKADGYGRYYIGGGRANQRVHFAHRAGWILLYGDPGMGHMDHLCRNRACVRPDHLEPVTARVNIARGPQSNDPSGMCRAGLHPWTVENILIEPPRLGQVEGVRRCRPCRDERERKYRPAKGKSTTCPSGHEFTPKNTGISRGHRFCRECHRARARAAYWRKKGAS